MYVFRLVIIFNAKSANERTKRLARNNCALVIVTAQVGSGYWVCVIERCSTYFTLNSLECSSTYESVHRKKEVAEEGWPGFRRSKKKTPKQNYRIAGGDDLPSIPRKVLMPKIRTQNLPNLNSCHGGIERDDWVIGSQIGFMVFCLSICCRQRKINAISWFCYSFFFFFLFAFLL